MYTVNQQIFGTYLFSAIFGLGLGGLKFAVAEILMPAIYNMYCCNTLKFERNRKVDERSHAEIWMGRKFVNLQYVVTSHKYSPDNVVTSHNYSLDNI